MASKRKVVPPLHEGEVVIVDPLGTDGGPIRTLSPGTQKHIDRYLWRWMVLGGVILASLSSAVGYALKAEKELAIEQQVSSFMAGVQATKDAMNRVTEETRAKLQSAQSEIQRELERAREASKSQLDRAADAEREIESAIRSAEQARKKAVQYLNDAAAGGPSKIAEQLLNDKGPNGLRQQIVDAAIGGAALVGAVMAWPSDAPLPGDNWAICGGEAEVEYNDELWEVLGGLYGNIDKESGTPKRIKLPDFRGYFLRGAGEQKGLFADLESRFKDLRYAEKADGPGSTQKPTTAQPSSQPQLGNKVLRLSHRSRGDYPSGPDNNHGVFEPLRDLLAWDDETRPINIAVHWIIRVK